MVRCIGLCQNDVFIPKLISGRDVKKKKATCVYQLTLPTGALKFGAVVAPAKERSSLRIFARGDLRLPFRLGQLITGDMLIKDGIPSHPKLLIRPQNLIPADSAIIKACQTCDLPEIQKLLTAKHAHPNDRTPDNLTVFRVSLKLSKILAYGLIVTEVRGTCRQLQGCTNAFRQWRRSQPAFWGIRNVSINT